MLRELGPMLVNSGPMSRECGPNVGRLWAQFGRTRPDLGPNRADSGPKPLWSQCSNSNQARSIPSRIWPKVAELGKNSVEIGPNRATWWVWVEIVAGLGTFGPNLATGFGPVSTNFGAYSAKLDDLLCVQISA